MNHYINRRIQGVNGLAGLKLDVSKAYDRLEWIFFEKMLSKYGFHELWIDRNVTCIKTVIYSFIQHGQVFSDVRPQRGIRQGDPISPHLYILCAEALNSIISRHEEVDLFHDCSIARGAPAVTHMLLADGCYFFYKAVESEAKVMKNLIQRYEGKSGQVVNFNKSAITFSPNTHVRSREIICGVLEVGESKNLGKYLGLAVKIGKKKNAVFSFLSNRVR